jgi:hypothetical protein
LGVADSFQASLVFFNVPLIRLKLSCDPLCLRLHLTVELHGARTRGQVVIDHLKRCDDNVKLVREVDVEKFKQLMYMAVDHPDCTL